MQKINYFSIIDCQHSFFFLKLIFIKSLSWTILWKAIYHNKYTTFLTPNFNFILLTYLKILLQTFNKWLINTNNLISPICEIEKAINAKVEEDKNKYSKILNFSISYIFVKLIENWFQLKILLYNCRKMDSINSVLHGFRILCHLEQKAIEEECFETYSKAIELYNILSGRAANKVM